MIHPARVIADPQIGVRATARELWTDAAGSNETVVVDLWDSYLEVP